MTRSDVPDYFPVNPARGKELDRIGAEHGLKRERLLFRLEGDELFRQRILDAIRPAGFRGTNRTATRREEMKLKEFLQIFHGFLLIALGYLIGWVCAWIHFQK